MQLRKRILSAVLAASMLASTAPSVFAKAPLVSGESEISFSAAKYNVAENEGKYKVKIVRTGGNDRSVAVAFKAADFMAVYGEDYVVLDENGDVIPMDEGISPDASDFSEISGSASDILLGDDTDTEQTKTVINDDGEADAAKAALEDAESGGEQTEHKKTRTSTGSTLLNARAEYLNLPDTESQAKESVEKALTSSNEYFQSARGATGYVVFEEGDTEKEITIKLIDNDKPEADKMVLLSLMGINGDDNTTLAANPTAYLNIMDDEAYEKPVIEPETTEVTLTDSAPEYALKLVRTAGVDYYTSVKVSTVKETAIEGTDYKKMEDASVSFAPGETEKTVKLSASCFDDDKSYGVRIESDGTCDVVNEYITVNIAAKAEEQTGDSAELMASAIGKEKTTLRLDDLNMKAGPSHGSQDGWHKSSWNAQSGWTDYHMYETYKNSGRTYLAGNPINLSGVDKVTVSHMNNGDYSGSYAAYHVFTEFLKNSDKNNYDSGGDANARYDDKHGWTTQDIDTKKLMGDYYLRFGIRNDGWASDNAHGWIGNPVTLTWRKYTFETGHNRQWFNRFLYNYDTKKGDSQKIAFTDGSDDYDYVPEGVYMVDSKNNKVTDFYCNANQYIKPYDPNAEKNAKYGIELEGVYLYVKADSELYGKEMKAPYTEHWYTDKTVWITASGVKVDQELAKDIQKNLGNDASVIKVMPKYKQKTITLNIHNTDNAKTYIANMNTSDKSNDSYRDWGSKGYYNQYTFPMYSKIKVRAIAAPKKTITSFLVDIWSLSTDKDPIYLDGNSPEKMTYVLMENMSFYPRTENQGMNIEYMPQTDKVIGDLTNRVYREPTVVDENTQTEKSDANGSINIETVYPGMMWIMRATAPEGYYVKWTNGTGDVKNINGQIEISDDPNINEETENTKRGDYNPVYGDIMSGRIIQDNTKYYYEFLPITSSAEIEIKGQVKRLSGTFDDIANNRAMPKVPVESTQVNIAGASCFTDSNGYFTIQVQNAPKSGLVSVIVDNEGTQYPTVALANNMSITMPAYECFKPKSLSVSYSDMKKNKINGTTANIKDDKLTVIAEVESEGSLQPVDAKFYLHKQSGSVINCNNDDRFTVSCANNTGILEFNPKAVMDTGDKIYVAFIDQNGKEYKSIDIGYTFVAPLNLRTFMMPMIGSTLLDETYDAATELIGDPLGDISLGKLKFDEPETEMVTPPGMDASEYSYIMSTYKWGDFSKAIKSFSGKYPEKKKDDSKETPKPGSSASPSPSTPTPKPTATPKPTSTAKPTATPKPGSETPKPSSEALKDAAKDATSDATAAPKTDEGGYKTKKSFSWSLEPKVAFAMQITTREVTGADGKKTWKYFFEELDFLVGLDFKVEGKITVTLPIGMNVIITGGLSGDVAGIFQLKTDYYADSTWDRNKVEYSADSFGLFEEIPNVDRTFYLMLNPKITFGLGIEFAIVEVGGHANFDFDMDFKFGMNAGNMTQHMYGDMTISFDYYVKVLSIKVYSGETEGIKVPLFSKNADGHIEPDIMDGLLSAADAPIESVPVDRDYLNHTTEWNPYMDGAELFDIDAADGTTETVLKSGVYPSSKFKLTNIGDGKLLMLFIGDVPERNAINRTALFYSIYDGNAWSQPVMVDDDGTLDDYPEATDIGDKVVVAWSSADRALEDGTTAQDALTALDIKVSFFDKQTHSFSDAERITHTTNEDYTADTEPKAAYDSETGRLILYYTKTEYKDADKLTDLIAAPSVIAYRFYENGKWNDETSYTDEELAGVEDKKTYKTEWYGQRFLDTRINKESGDMLRIVDSDVCYYNGLALYAWTVDYDKDMNTVEDRDVFMQIYNFEENSFTHIIKMTVNAGAYSTPQFGRYNDNTYLFFSAVGDLGGGEDAGASGIAYINVSEPIKNDRYTLVENGETQYYVLQYTAIVPESETSDGMVIPAHEVTVSINPTYAVTVKGYVNNYSVDIDKNERMYLTWTDSVTAETAQRQVFTSVYDVAADENDEKQSEASWSEAFMLTGAPSTAYSSIDAAVLNGELYIAADKTPYIEDDGAAKLDENNASMVILKHTPYSKPVTAEEDALTIDTHYVYPDTPFTLISTVNNEGVKFIHEPVTFKFSMTSGSVVTYLGEQTLDHMWGAGRTLSASVDVEPISEISDDLTFNAEVTIGETVINQTFKAVKEYNIISDGDAVIEEKTDGHLVSVPLRNDGNIPSGKTAVKLYTVKDGEKDALIAEFETDSIAENSSELFGGTVAIPDEAFVIDGGDGVADIIAVIETDGKELKTLETKAHRYFDENAIQTLSKITGVSLKKNGTINAKYLDDISIETEITGEASDKVKVVWESSNSNVVYVREDGTLCALGNGTAKLTGYVVPDVQSIIFEYDGSSSTDNMLSMIPSNLYKTVTAKVSVTGGPRSSSGGGGGGSSAASTPAPTATPTPEPTAAPSSSPEPNAGAEMMFEDTAGHWAASYIERLAKDGIVNGMSEKQFAPDGLLTRAQYVKLLMQTGLVAADDVKPVSFADVSADAWYAQAVAWAVSCGIAKGISDTEFAPDALITREQMAVMTNRFAVIAGIKSKTETRTEFTDAALVSEWAVSDVMALAAMGIIGGREDGTFDPKANMTRAESAVVICNMLELKEAE